MLQYVDLATLEESLDHIREAPADAGTLELIVRRPAVDEREVLTEVRLDTIEGLEGDTWRARGSSRTADGGPNPDAQLTVVNARASAAIAGDRDRWRWRATSFTWISISASRTCRPAAGFKSGRP